MFEVRQARAGASPLGLQPVVYVAVRSGESYPSKPSAPAGLELGTDALLGVRSEANCRLPLRAIDIPAAVGNDPGAVYPFGEGEL
jgi:hypothetical protein